MAWFLALKSAAQAILQSKTVTAGTSASIVTPDSGYDGLSSVTVNPTPSQAKSVTATTTAQTVAPDAGNLLSSVTVNPQNHTATYTASTRNAALDMGANNNNRYVDTTGVPNSNSGVKTITSSDANWYTGNVDMGATNTYRYVNAVNVYNKGKEDGKVNVKINMAQGYTMLYDHLDFANAANNSSITIGNGVGTYDLCDDFSCTITPGTWAIYTFTIKKAKSYIVYGATYNGTNYTTLTILSLPAGASVRMMDPNVFDQYGLRFIACIAD